MILAAKPRTEAFAGYNTAMVSESLASVRRSGRLAKGGQKRLSIAKTDPARARQELVRWRRRVVREKRSTSSMVW